MLLIKLPEEVLVLLVIMVRTGTSSDGNTGTDTSNGIHYIGISVFTQ